MLLVSVQVIKLIPRTHHDGRTFREKFSYKGSSRFYSGLSHCWSGLASSSHARHMKRARPSTLHFEALDHPIRVWAKYNLKLLFMFFRNLFYQIIL